MSAVNNDGRQYGRQCVKTANVDVRCRSVCLGLSISPDSGHSEPARRRHTYTAGLADRGPSFINIESGSRTVARLISSAACPRKVSLEIGDEQRTVHDDRSLLHDAMLLLLLITSLLHIVVTNYAPYRALLTLRRNSNTICSDWLLTFCKPFIISAFYLISYVTTYTFIFLYF